MAEWIYWMPLLAIPIVLLFRFIGCGELLSAGPEAFDFDVEVVTAATFTVNQGAVTTAQIKVISRGGYNNDVSLSVEAGPQWTASISPSTVNPKSGEAGATLSIGAAAQAPLGTSNVTVTGKGAGPKAADGAPPNPEIVKSRTVTLTTAASGPDFIVTVTPTPSQVSRPNPAIFAVALERIGAFTEPVDLSVVVNGAVQNFGGFNPDPLAGPALTSTLTVPTASAPPGVHKFYVRGRGTMSGTERSSGETVLTIV